MTRLMRASLTTHGISYILFFLFIFSQSLILSNQHNVTLLNTSVSNIKYIINEKNSEWFSDICVSSVMCYWLGSLVDSLN